LQVLNGKIDELIKIGEDQAANKIKAKLQEIVPEYKPVITVCKEFNN
jgi:hypothetical protein